jgi:hypothetical protein
MRKLKVREGRLRLFGTSRVSIAARLSSLVVVTADGGTDCKQAD